MDIFIREVDNRGVFDAYLDSQLLVRSSATPLLTAARALLALRANPDEPLRMLWPDWPSFPSLTTTVATAAKTRISTTRGGTPEFRKWEADEAAAVIEEAAE